MISPSDGSTFSGSSVLFTWTQAPGADCYWLDVGNSVGQGDIFARQIPDTCQNGSGYTSWTVYNIPTDGRIIYVQLWTHTNGAWQTPQRYTYHAYATSLV